MKLNGKEIPFTDSWDTVTFAQFLRIIHLQLKELKEKKKDYIERTSILSGIPAETLLKASIKGLENIMFKSEFLDTECKFPETPTRLGKTKLPSNNKGAFDIQFESLAQFEDMRIIMSKVENNIHSHTEAYATYCALYLQKLIDGEYNNDKAMEMIPEIMNYPAREVVPAGSFFFLKLKSLSSGTKPNSPTTLKSRKKRTGKSIRKRSGSRPHLTKRAKR